MERAATFAEVAEELQEIKVALRSVVQRLDNVASSATTGQPGAPAAARGSLRHHAARAPPPGATSSSDVVGANNVCCGCTWRAVGVLGVAALVSWRYLGPPHARGGAPLAGGVTST